MFGNCNHCCFCCGHPCTMLDVSLVISCKNKIQCVCVCVCVCEKKNHIYLDFFWTISMILYFLDDHGLNYYSFEVTRTVMIYKYFSLSF